MSDETFNIKSCPLCGKSHTYLLNVHRSKYQLSPINSSVGKSKRFKRLLTCPKKNETFLATLEMKEDERGIIRNVTIDGISIEDKNGEK